MVRVKVENPFIEAIFKEGRYVLKSTMSYFAWNLVTQGFISTYVVDIGNVFASKEPTVIQSASSVKKDL